MDGLDTRIIRGAAIPTAAAGVVAVLLSWVFAGGHGALGALIGAGIVATFFSVGLVAMSYAARVSPSAMMPVAMITYLVKILTLGVLLVAFGDTTAFDVQAFAWTVIACTLVWIAFQMRSLSKQKILYVDPDGGR